MAVGRPISPTVHHPIPADASQGEEFRMTEWEEISIPIIQYVWECEQTGSAMLDVEAIAQKIGQDPERTDAAVRRLYEDGWISATELDHGSFAKSILLQPRVGARGMRAIGHWPTDDPLKELLIVVERRAQAETDPVEKSKWTSLAERMTDIGSAALGAVLAEFLKRSAGMI